MAADDAARDLRRLNLIAVVGVLDAVLLVPLVLGVLGVLDTSAYVGAVGGAHGVGFLVLVGLTGAGALARRWGWWFPALTIITGGPVGSLVGDVVLRRRLRRASGGPEAGAGDGPRARGGDARPDGA